MMDIEIRHMQGDDIEFAVELTTAEDWGNVKPDFQRLLFFEPQGCFIASSNGCRVGMITTVTYGSLGFLGSLIVIPGSRGQGIGTRLLEEAIARLRGRGVSTLELDGVLEAVPLYRRLGFQNKYRSLRFCGRLEGTPDQVVHYSPECREEIRKLDYRLTGLQRGRIIDRLLDEYADSSFLTKDGELTGYAVVRARSSGRLACGPLVAGTVQEASRLLTAIGSQYPAAPVALGIPEINRAMIGLMRSNGFEESPPSLRMYLGEKIDYEEHVYAIASPEKG